MELKAYDAIIVGAGPNGLAAATHLAQMGESVLVVEGADTIGGGTRTAERTLPGFQHDVCSTVHPLALASPFFRRLDLAQEGLRWVHPPIPLAHPLDDGTAVLLNRSMERTVQLFGVDGRAYQRLMDPFVDVGVDLLDDLLAPLHWPSGFATYARFGWLGLASARHLVGRFQREPARALFGGLAAHSMLPLEAPLTGAIALILGILAHQVGWPFAAGGSQQIADALACRLKVLGGRVETGLCVTDLHDLPPARHLLLNLTPRQILGMAGEHFTVRYRRQLARYRYGPGVFKMDYALNGPIPWRAKSCHQAGTLHLGGTFEEIAESEQAVWQGEHPEQPFVLLTQPTLFDPSRAPAGKHIAWAYCHVPHGSTHDMSRALEAQIERFAPGFQDTILARQSMTAVEMESYNPNYIGGDINSGVQDWRQLFTRPVPRCLPYTTPDPGVFLCSSATPPGGGVHGMGGYYAAEVAMKRLNRSRSFP
jgi:phytoene dehydrogenase-like protein